MIDNVKRLYDLDIRQQPQIDELEITVTRLTSPKNQQMARLSDENKSCKANLQQLELGRAKLKEEKASMNDLHKTVQPDNESNSPKGGQMRSWTRKLRSERWRKSD